MQIIFCSRTHSQLSQLVSELRRTDLTSKVSVVTLAARKASEGEIGRDKDAFDGELIAGDRGIGG